MHLTSGWHMPVSGVPPSSRPPPLGTISDGRLPIAHKITPTVLRCLYPKYANLSIHEGSSFNFYAKGSRFAIHQFKWSSGNINVSTWPFNNDLHTYDCHLSGKRHVMEPLAKIALCTVADPICQLFLHAWPRPFAAIAQQWWSSPPPPPEIKESCSHLRPALTTSGLPRAVSGTVGRSLTPIVSRIAPAAPTRVEGGSHQCHGVTTRERAASPAHSSPFSKHLGHRQVSV